MNPTPRAVDGPLLEALSCSRGIGVPSLPPSCCRAWHLQKVAKIQCISRRRRLRLLGASRREPNDALGEMTLPAGTRVHVIDSAGEYGPTSRPFPIDVVPRFTPLSREAQSAPQARSRVQRVRFHDATRWPRLHLVISSSTQSPVTSSSVDAAPRSSREPLGGVCHHETFINLILLTNVSALENRVRTRRPPDRPWF